VTAYYILFIMIFIASIQEAFKKDKILYAYWKFFILLFLWFIIGGRYEGVDYYGYVGYFNNAPPFKSYFISFNQFISYFSSYVEFGFLFLMSLSKVLGFEFHHFLLVFSFFIVFLRYKAINKSTQFIITAILIYMGTGFIYDMGQIRNSLSSVLVLNAVLEYADGKTRKGIFLTVIASLIHMVSIVAFIIPLLIRLEKKLVVYLFLLSLIIAYFLPLGQFLSYIGSNIPILYIGNKLTGYLESDKYTEYSASLFSLGMIRSYLFVFATTFYYDKIKSQSKYFPFLYNTMIFGYIFSMLTRDFTIISYRLRSLFGAPEPIVYSMLLGVYKGKGRIFVFAILALYSILLFFNNIGVLPQYKNYFLGIL